MVKNGNCLGNAGKQKLLFSQKMCPKKRTHAHNKIDLANTTVKPSVIISEK